MKRYFLQRIRMSEKTLRVRFAPAPTGMMHLGNIRTALMNYLIAQKQQGTLILRIEDTDTERNFDPKAEKIIEDLTWLSLDYQEGPVKGGPHAPYFQSQRNDLYQKELEKFISHNKVYRCFCTAEELEKKRNRQIALKQPPRYDKTCLKLDKETSEIAQVALKLRELIETDGWTIAKNKLSERILDLQNAFNIESNDPTTMLIDLQARKIATRTLYDWLKDVEGTATQIDINLQNVKQSHIIRED
ncbi:MAG: hypothetical protein EBU90_23230 [Proteobacteria bacterium]|nr:hypothetical protein [Pseudomonadota bacterium]